MVPPNPGVHEACLLPKMLKLIRGKRPQHREWSVVSGEAVGAPNRRSQHARAPIIEAASLEVAHQNQRPGNANHLPEQLDSVFFGKVMERQNSEAHLEGVIRKGQPEGVAHQNAEGVGMPGSSDCGYLWVIVHTKTRAGDRVVAGPSLDLTERVSVAGSDVQYSGRRG